MFTSWTCQLELGFGIWVLLWFLIVLTGWCWKWWSYITARHWYFVRSLCFAQWRLGWMPTRSSFDINMSTIYKCTILTILTPNNDQSGNMVIFTPLKKQFCLGWIQDYLEEWCCLAERASAGSVYEELQRVVIVVGRRGWWPLATMRQNLWKSKYYILKTSLMSRFLVRYYKSSCSLEWKYSAPTY